MARTKQQDIKHYLDLCNMYIKDDAKKLYLQGVNNWWDVKTVDFEEILTGQTLKGCYDFAVSLYRVLTIMEG